MKYCLTLTSVLIVMFVCIGFVPSKTPDWRKIIPLESTRGDVERLFGKTKTDDEESRYELKDGTLEVSYASGLCKYEDDWNVSKGTVVKVTFEYRKSIDFSAKIADKTNLIKKSVGECTPQVFNYIDESKGISYGVFEENEKTLGKLEQIEISPDLQHKHFLCSIPEDESAK